MGPENIFNFKVMITPKIITLVYWISIIAITVIALLVTAGGENPLIGVIILFAGLIFIRIWCELLIVLFKINENLQTLVNYQALSFQQTSQPQKNSDHFLDREI